uniref:Glycerophosphocholine phosphodiesterase 1 n=1 Tax=Sarcophilus harrisii TaxID=9305 RepID=G3WHX8_SARHA
MTHSQLTFEIRGTPLPGEIFAICGDCDALGNWNPQYGVALKPEEKPNEGILWRTTVALNKGVPVQYRYFKGYFVEPKRAKALLMMDSLESTMVLKISILDG